MLGNPKRRLLLLIILALCAAAFVALAVHSQSVRDETARGHMAEPSERASSAVMLESSPEPQPSPEMSGNHGEQETDETDVFIVRTHKGYIAVFYAGGKDAESLAWTTDTRVAALRRADQMLLQNGVTLHGRMAVAQFLEDFSY